MVYGDSRVAGHAILVVLLSGACSLDGVSPQPEPEPHLNAKLDPARVTVEAAGANESFVFGRNEIGLQHYHSQVAKYSS